MERAKKDASNARPAANRQRRSSQGDVPHVSAQAGSSGAGATQQQQQQQQQRPGVSLSRTQSQQPMTRHANAPAPSGTGAGTGRPPPDNRKSTDESMRRKQPVGGAPNDGPQRPDDRPPRGERELSSAGPLRSNHAQNQPDRDNKLNHNGPGLSRNNTPFTHSPVEMRSMGGGPSQNGTDPQSRGGVPGPGHLNGPSGAAVAAGVARGRMARPWQPSASTTPPSSATYHSGDDGDEREEHRRRRYSQSRSRPHDIETGLGGGQSQPALSAGTPRMPQPTVQTANLRNSLRRNTIMDSPDVQRSSQSYEDEKEARSNGIKNNIEKLLNDVKSTKDKCSKKALKTVWALNLAVGLQVTLGALTTGFAAVIKGDRISLIIALIGGVSTLCASYLARMRGSSEPEKSLAMKKELTALKLDLEHFQRRVEELSLMEDHVEQRVRRRLSEYQQRYFDIRNAGFGGPAAAAVTNGEQMDHDERLPALPYGAGSAQHHHYMGHGHPNDRAGYPDRDYL